MEDAIKLNDKDVNMIRELYRTRRRHCSTFDDLPTRWHICIHEAAHAILAMSLGYEVEKLTVYRIPHNGDMGETKISDTLIGNKEDSTIIALAGVIIDRAAHIDDIHSSADVYDVDKNLDDTVSYSYCYEECLRRLTVFHDRIIGLANKIYYLGSAKNLTPSI